MITAVIYCRCSTEEESQVNALEKQAIEAETCVNEMGWKLVDRYIESKSGTTAKGRDEYQRLCQDMSSGKFDVLVIKSQDRLMRNVKDWYLFLDRMLVNGKKLYLYLERKFYTQEDSLLTGIKAILAEEYSRELSKKIVNAHRNRQRNGGKIMMTNKVYGYQKMPDGTVIVVEEEAEIIRRIFRYCAAGYGARTIANILKQEGVRSKNGKLINASRVGHMIRSPLYNGIIVMNRQHYDFETKKIIYNPPEEWICKKGIVPVIVDDELWKSANDAMTKRAIEHHQDGVFPKGSNPGKYSLSGKLICAECREPYYRTWRRAYADSEKVIVEWKCSTYLTKGRRKKNRRDSIRKPKSAQIDDGCDNSHLDEETLFRLLEEVSAQYYHIDCDEKNGIIQRTMEILEKSLVGGDNDSEIERLSKMEKGLSDKKDKLMEKLLDDVISDGEFVKVNQKLDTELKQIQEKKKRIVMQKQEYDHVLRRLQEIRNRLENGGIERATVGQMLKDVKQIIVHEWQIELQFEPLKLVGISEREYADLLGISNQAFSIFVDYPFTPRTENARICDCIQIMELLKENHSYTAKQLAGIMGKSLGMIHGRMKKLKSGGYIKFNGAGGSGYWEILKEFPNDTIQRKD